MDENKKHEQLLYVLLGAVLFIFFWLAIITGVLIGMSQGDLTSPETDAVIETTDSETAPVETVPVTSIPETEPIIHTEPEETEPEVTEPPETEAPALAINPDDLEMLACVIYQEAGADYICDECRRRVADVVLNRVADPKFPNTIRGVLTAPGQYGNFSVTGVVWPERASYPGEAHAVCRAYRIAKEILLGKHSDLYGKGYIWQATFIQGKDNVYCCGHYYGR